MMVAQLRDAAIRYSDNTAGYLLLRELGGPTSITAFCARWGRRPDPTAGAETGLGRTMAYDRHRHTTPRHRSEPTRASPSVTRSQPRTGNGSPAGCSPTPPAATGSAPVSPQAGSSRAETGGGRCGGNNDAVAWPPDGAPIVMAVLTIKHMAGTGGPPAGGQARGTAGGGTRVGASVVRALHAAGHPESAHAGEAIRHGSPRLPHCGDVHKHERSRSRRPGGAKWVSCPCEQTDREGTHAE